ncbi:MAG: hypothetical protein DWI21_03785 [Planctomycetota bacterium]|nr:MAG: hypothetical protein DWI21_03785 [Planctomycetota bacterium]
MLAVSCRFIRKELQAVSIQSLTPKSTLLTEHNVRSTCLEDTNARHQPLDSRFAKCPYSNVVVRQRTLKWRHENKIVSLAAKNIDP